VIVNDLNLLWPGTRPQKADSPLVIDSDAMFPGSITLERFKPVPRWDAEIIKGLRGPHLTKLAQCHSLDPRID
jgi:hypothetical protein